MAAGLAHDVGAQQRNKITTKEDRAQGTHDNRALMHDARSLMLDIIIEPSSSIDRAFIEHRWSLHRALIEPLSSMDRAFIEHRSSLYRA